MLEFLKSLWKGFDKKWVSNFLSAVRNFLLVFGGSATSENKWVAAQNLALCKVLGSKCEKNNCAKHSGEFRELVFTHNLPFIATEVPSKKERVPTVLGVAQI